jgi:hypothetical protein
MLLDLAWWRAQQRWLPAFAALQSTQWATCQRLRRVNVLGELPLVELARLPEKALTMVGAKPEAPY